MQPKENIKQKQTYENSLSWPKLATPINYIHCMHILYTITKQITSQPLIHAGNRQNKQINILRKRVFCLPKR